MPGLFCSCIHVQSLNSGHILHVQHIKTWMSAVGWTVTEDRFIDYAPVPRGIQRFSNIIATLDPGKARRVVLACHYDSKVIPGTRFVGAIDAAVPCSLLMESALRLQTIFSDTKRSNSVGAICLLRLLLLFLLLFSSSSPSSLFHSRSSGDSLNDSLNLDIFVCKCPFSVSPLEVDTFFFQELYMLDMFL